MTSVDREFIDEVLFEPSAPLRALTEPRYVFELISKFGRHRTTKLNSLSVYEHKGRQSIKIHKDLQAVVTPPRDAMPNLSLTVEVRPTFPSLDKNGRARKASASIHDLKANGEERTFSFIIRPEHVPVGKGPRRAEDPNAFTLVLRLLDGEGNVIDTSTLEFSAFANPNSREKARRGLSVVPCFLSNGLSTLTEASKEAFLGEAPPAVFYPEVNQNAVALEIGCVETHSPFSSSSSSSSSSMEVESLSGPYEFANSPLFEPYSPSFFYQ